MLVDTHAHIYVEDFDLDREEMLSRAEEAGVKHIVMPNVDLASLPRIIEVAARYPGRVSLALGLHPTSVGEDYFTQLAHILPYLEDRSLSVVAIGEVGLDLYWDQSMYAYQVKALQIQIDWAIAHDLPLILHVRNAYDETLSLLSDHPQRMLLRGVFHCFEGEPRHAEWIREHLPGMMFGINGNVTYKKSVLASQLCSLPRDRMILETDAPYLAPVPMRGKRCEPSFIVHTARWVADRLGVSLDEVESFSTDNAIRLFGVFV